jgi:Protein of unknown function (DUF1353)
MPCALKDEKRGRGSASLLGAIHVATERDARRLEMQLPTWSVAMPALSRRTVIHIAVRMAAVSSWPRLATATEESKGIVPFSTSASTSAEQWMKSWMNPNPQSKDVAGPLRMGRFADPMYFLLDQIEWRPGVNQPSVYPIVRVPSGFVTDLASIPQVFWSMLRPDGMYAYPAITHDYLYWFQLTSKAVADDILRLGMQDLGVSKQSIFTIYEAVNYFGQTAWVGNARLRAQGEKRVIARFPNDPKVTWSDWKQRPEVFE